MRLINLICFSLYVLPIMTGAECYETGQVKQFIDDDKYIILKPLNVGDLLKEHSYIKVNSESQVTIRYEVDDLTRNFINDVICSGNMYVAVNNLFGGGRVKLNVSEKYLDATMEGGAYVHLRGDVKGKPQYKTFKNGEISGEVVDIAGSVFVSQNVNIISDHYSDLFFQHFYDYSPEDALSITVNADGSTTSVHEIDSRALKARSYPVPNIEGELSYHCSADR